MDVFEIYWVPVNFLVQKEAGLGSFDAVMSSRLRRSQRAKPAALAS
jgi:hypothetical protein